MFDQPTYVFAAEQSLAAKVRVLIFARLALIFVVLVGGWLWTGQISGSSDPSQSRLVIFFLIAIGLTAAYSIWLRYGRALLWHVRTQFFIDALLITWLVWETGDLISPNVTLYIILISVAGFYLGKNDAHFVAVLCALCFTLLSALTAQSLIYSLSGDVAPSKALQIVAFNDAAFLLVGLLAARLADRRKIGEELKKAEANFADLNVLHERILASINSGLITTDLQGRIYAFNRAAEEISGLNARDTVGKSVFSVFGDEIRAPVEMCLGGVQTAEFSPPHFEAGVRSLTNGNSAKPPVTVACSVSPLVGKTGGVSGLIIAFQDRSELHAMEDNLRRSDRLAAVGRLAAGLAHELRNPLGSMSSALQFLSEKGDKNTEEAELMSVVLRESDRLNAIITNFLAYARPQSTTAIRNTQLVDVGEAIGDCLALIRHDPAVSEEHEFAFERPETPVVVRADERRHGPGYSSGKSRTYLRAVSEWRGRHRPRPIDRSQNSHRTRRPHRCREPAERRNARNDRTAEMILPFYF
jgi:two-component system sensor histidine kinase PilS (NtrC family)